MTKIFKDKRSRNTRKVIKTTFLTLHFRFNKIEFDKNGYFEKINDAEVYSKLEADMIGLHPENIDFSLHFSSYQ